MTCRDFWDFSDVFWLLLCRSRSQSRSLIISSLQWNQCVYWPMGSSSIHDQVFYFFHLGCNGQPKVLDHDMKICYWEQRTRKLHHNSHWPIYAMRTWLWLRLRHRKSRKTLEGHKSLEKSQELSEIWKVSKILAESEKSLWSLENLLESILKNQFSSPLDLNRLSRLQRLSIFVYIHKSRKKKWI